MICPMCNSNNINKKVDIIRSNESTMSKRFYICQDCNYVWQTEGLTTYHSYSILRRKNKNAKRQHMGRVC